jgi:hypothetical protein
MEFIININYLLIKKNKMDLNNLIAKSYGSMDNEFANHELDRQRALESLIVADKEGIGYTEFIRRHRNYLEEKGCPESKIIEQLEKVKTLSTYFKLD